MSNTELLLAKTWFKYFTDYLHLFHFIITYFIFKTFPIIVFIKSINYINYFDYFVINRVLDVKPLVSTFMRSMPTF